MEVLLVEGVEGNMSRCHSPDFLQLPTSGTACWAGDLVRWSLSARPQGMEQARLSGWCIWSTRSIQRVGKLWISLAFHGFSVVTVLWCNLLMLKPASVLGISPVFVCGCLPATSSSVYWSPFSVFVPPSEIWYVWTPFLVLSGQTIRSWSPIT